MSTPRIEQAQCATSEALDALSDLMYAIRTAAIALDRCNSSWRIASRVELPGEEADEVADARADVSAALRALEPILAARGALAGAYRDLHADECECERTPTTGELR